MAISQSNLPEGTDSIVSDGTNGDFAGSTGTGFTSATASRTSDAASAAASKLGDAAAKVGDATASLRAQATDKAFGYAAQGKERAVGVLDNVTKLVDDAAGQIDEKAGEQYGAYARQASQAVAGLADTLRDKDVEELFDDARDLVRKSPAIAIGAAAAIGFVVARLLKVGLAEGTAQTSDRAQNAPVHPRTTPSTATTVPVDTAF
ncbi:hypothetical protein [Sphingomonas solaris]|uniref:hypothetical protein n=1 Tax=Alterirhizorhabdus solaris TaxID=2529389 RepID=UPI00193A2D4A|nr:hypothetical protein [Sphingomonas solaris]